MRRMIPAILTLFALPPQVYTDEGDDTLRHYIAKSQVIVCGRIKTEPTSFIEEGDIAHHTFELELTEVLHGKVPKKLKLLVGVHRYEEDQDDELPYLKKGQKCILFLKRPPATTRVPDLVSADMWFGIQPYSSTMVQAIKRLVAANGETKLEKPIREDEGKRKRPPCGCAGLTVGFVGSRASSYIPWLSRVRAIREGVWIRDPAAPPENEQNRIEPLKPGSEFPPI